MGDERNGERRILLTESTNGHSPFKYQPGQLVKLFINGEHQEVRVTEGVASRSKVFYEIEFEDSLFLACAEEDIEEAIE